MNAQKWVAIWGSSPSISEPHPARYAKNITLRYVLRAMLDGEKIRLHLSNLGGQEDVVIPRVYVAPVTQGSDTDESRMLPVTFGGDFACKMAAGESVESDIVELPLKRGQDYAVSLYLGDKTQATAVAYRAGGEASILLLSLSDGMREKLIAQWKTVRR